MHLQRAELFQSLFAVLYADTGTPVATEGDVRINVQVLIDPHCSGIEPSCNVIEEDRRSTPYRSAQPIRRTVRQTNSIVQVAIFDDGAYGAEVLANNKRRVSGRIIQQSNGEKQPRSFCRNISLIKDIYLGSLYLLPGLLQAFD